MKILNFENFNQLESLFSYEFKANLDRNFAYKKTINDPISSNLIIKKLFNMNSKLVMDLMENQKTSDNV